MTTRNTTSNFGLTRRLFLLILAINTLLLPFLLWGVLYIVEKGYEEKFIDNAKTETYLFSKHAANNFQTETLRPFFEEAALSGMITYIQLIDVNSKNLITIGAPSSPEKILNDSEFGQNNDYTYYNQLKVIDFNGTDKGTLIIGFDELPTLRQIQLAYKRGLYITFAYIVLTLSLIIFLRPKITALTKQINEQQQELAYRAIHDELTGLPNRNYFSNKLKNSVESCSKDGSPFAILLMDLNFFKEINDALGHQVGDTVLRHIASRLLETARPTDVVARMGGDEFAVLLVSAGPAQAVAFTEKLMMVLHKPIVTAGRTLHIGPSIGIAVFPDHGRDSSTLLRRADISMYTAKQNGLGYTQYEHGLDMNPIKKLTIGTELREGIQNDQLVVYYQPKVDLTTCKVYSAEALVRWEHPRRGLVSPIEFIPLAEQIGLIEPITLEVFKKTLWQYRSWEAKGIYVEMAVNISARNLQDETLPDQLINIVNQLEIDPSRIELELTESAIFSDPDRAIDILKRIHTQGFKLAIDDFGTGYSSLIQLRRLPLSHLKIDRSFVRDMIHNENDTSIVRAIIDMAHDLDMIVIAEGVENQATMDKLKAMGCDRVQGYFISPPLSAEKFEQWLMNSNWKP